MGVVVLASIRSCGTTTLAVALAATWPAGRRVLMVELDPAGGSLAAASGWPAEPSLVSLAAAARRSSDPEAIWAHCQHLPGGAAVLAAPARAEQARSAARMLAGLFGRLGELDADVVVVDVGRLDPTEPLARVVTGAGRVVLCARPRLPDLHALATFVETESGARVGEVDRLGLVLVGDGPYPDDEIAEALGIDVLGRLPWDPEAAELLTSLSASDRRLRLSPLRRSARSLADALATEGAPLPMPASVPAPTSGEKIPATALLRDRLLGPLRTRPAADARSPSHDVGIAGNGVFGNSTTGSGAVVNGTGPGGEVTR